MTISIGTSHAPSTRDTHAAWLRRRLAPDAAATGGTAVLERRDPDAVTSRSELLSRP
ncbi:hypothetical protein [Actinoplanes italicus]|uniref:Uncharacterized protein n=1 Tax=Actinoplanes italicus TaxID=113567 RepID=A0A2T0JYM7_9ACTN|nr:hypothetical protein [Actinoplanes italicus]PRX13947.1 hypothetical protein CLV67_124136 [Actinoplanes italicus]